jgi:NADH:ubiquinone oxidoreductase subunit E
VEAKSTLIERWGMLDSELTPEQQTLLDQIIHRYRNRPGGLIPVLEEVQEALGYLPASVQARVAKGLGRPFAEVYGVVTFYHFFTMEPRGKHTCRVCLGTACYIRGGRKNLEHLVDTLGIHPGQTTPDREFSLDTVRCLGACALAPAMTLDGETFAQVKPQKINQILDGFR